MALPEHQQGNASAQEQRGTNGSNDCHGVARTSALKLLSTNVVVDLVVGANLVCLGAHHSSRDPYPHESNANTDQDGASRYERATVLCGLFRPGRSLWRRRCCSGGAGHGEHTDQHTYRKTPHVPASTS